MLELERDIDIRRLKRNGTLVIGETRFTVRYDKPSRVFYAAAPIRVCAGCAGQDNGQLCELLPGNCGSISDGDPVFVEDTPEGRAHYAAALLTS